MQTVSGVFTLWFDANGNGVADPGETFNVAYDESTPAVVAQQIQGWLQSFTPVPGKSNATQATVSPVDPQDYLVDFGPQTTVLDQSNLLHYLSPNNSLGPGGSMAPSTFTLSGFAPAVSITTLDRPFVITGPSGTGIPVSQNPVNGPQQTASAIAAYFQQQVDALWGVQSVAPINMPPPERVTATNTAEGPYQSPVANHSTPNAPTTPDEYYPTVSVLPVTLPDGTLSSTQFDVEFTGIFGDRQEPAMQVVAASDENGVPIDTKAWSQVQILKESSNQFQVNPPEQSSVYSPYQASLSADEPAVAMDAAGDFVIAWRGDVSYQTTPKDVADIYARMYSPVGITDSYNPNTYVPGLVSQAGQGVQIRPNPTVSQIQDLVFNATGALPVQGSFVLQFRLHDHRVHSVRQHESGPDRREHPDRAGQRRFSGCAGG